MRHLPHLITAALATTLILGFATATGTADTTPVETIATVDGQPAIERTEFDHWMTIAASRGDGYVGLPDRPVYVKCAERLLKTKRGKGRSLPQRRASCAHMWRELRDSVLGFLVAARWLKGEAAEQHVTVTSNDVDKAFRKQKQQAFPDDADFQRFLQTSRSTEADIRFQLEVEQLQINIIKKIQSAVGVTAAEVDAYYRTHPDRFVTPAGRDTLIVLTDTKADAVKARRALDQGRSWAAVRAKYGADEDEAFFALRTLVTRKNKDDPPFARAVFRAPLRTIMGPMSGDLGWYIFEVRGRTRRERTSLRDARPTIRSLLTIERQQQAVTDFLVPYRKRWLARTRCAAGYTIKDCGGELLTQPG